MGFAKYANTIEQENARSGLKKKTGKDFDLTKPEGLIEYAATKGVGTEPKEKSIIPSFLLKGVSGGFDALLWTSRQSGKALQIMKGTNAKDVDPTLMPSEVLFGKIEEPETFWGSLKRQFTTGDGLKRLAVDIALDPLTYLTLGTGAAIKVATQAGVKVALQKTGKELVKELAEEMVQKGVLRKVAIQRAKEQTGDLVSTKAASMLERGGLQTIMKGLKKVGKETSAVEVQRVISGGLSELIKKPAVRFAGKEVMKLPTTKQIFKNVVGQLDKVKYFRPLARGLEITRKTFGKLFIRDFDLPKQFIPIKQKFIDGFDATSDRIKKDLSIIFNGVSKTQRIAIARAIDKGKILELPIKEKKLAQRVQNIFKAVAREEEKRGLLDKTMVNYVPHIYRNKEKAKTIIKALRQGQPSASLRFNKARLLQDFDAAKALGLDPVEDIAMILNIRLLASEKAKLTQDFIGKVFSKLGVRERIPTGKLKTIIKRETRFVKGGVIESKDIAKAVSATKRNPELRDYILGQGDSLVKLSEAVTGIPKKYQGVLVPSKIADDIASMGKVFFNEDATNQLLRGYDNIHNFWKGSVTVMFPAFHFRNAISNIAQNFLDIGVNAINPIIHRDVVKIVSGIDGTLVTDFGEKISFSQIKKIAKQSQVLQGTLRITDIGRKLNKNVLAKTTPFELGRKLGRTIENEARLVNFVTNIKRGMDIEDAAAATKQFLFDYDNLSLFEKDTLRRAIPFYTWTRKNIALQLKAMVTQPGKQVGQAKVLNSINDMFGKQLTDDEKKFTPEWISKGLNILIDRKGDDRTFLVGFDLPLESFFDITTQSCENPFRAVMNQMSPFLKIFLEVGTGVNLFLQKKLGKDDTGQFADNLPKVMQNWLEYSSKEVFPTEGKPFVITKVDPKKKFIWKNVTSVLGAGRLSSATTVNGCASIYKFCKGEPLLFQDKTDILRLFTAFTFKTSTLEGEKRRQEKEERERLTEELKRKGEVAEVTIPFIPKEKKKETSRTRVKMR